MNDDHHVSLNNHEVLTKLSKIHIARQSQHLSKFYKQATVWTFTYTKLSLKQDHGVWLE